jgi:glycosyltransferase involved in cell wall biosynthesis
VKILFINNFYYLRGGSEKVLFEEMRLLREAGHETAVFSRSNDKNEPSQFAEFFPPPLDTERVGISLASLYTAKELVYSNAARRGVREVIKRFRPDMAHAHNIYGRLTMSVLDELKSVGVPVVMTLHDLKPLCPSYLMLRNGVVCERCKGKKFHNAVLTRCHKGSYPASFVYALESWINHSLGKYCSVRRFITPSRFLMDKCLEYGWDSGKLAYIANFIDRSQMRECRAGGEYLLYIGRLSREKGVGTLLKAYSCLERPIPLVIVGEGPEREALQKDAQAARLQVTFTGYLSGEALAGTLNGAKGIVMPSEWYENAPLSLLEAFAAGKPVIGARIGGIPEMIDEGVTGFLFEPGNADDLAAMMRRFMMLSPEIIARMGRSARSKVEESFTEKRHMEDLLKLYREVDSSVERCDKRRKN